MMRFLREQRGLTFVELLAVILILGILVAAALPNYFGAENDARHAVDQANVRAINAALALFRMKTGRCPNSEAEFSDFLSDPDYFPDSPPPPQDPVDKVGGQDKLPGDSAHDDYPKDYDAGKCRVKKD